MARSNVQRRLRELAAEFEPALRRSFLDAVADIVSRAELGRIVARLEAGDIEGALAAVHIDPAAYRALDGLLGQAYIGGGIAAIEGMPVLRDPSGARLVIRFDGRDPRAERWLRDYSSTLITRIADDQRQAVRVVLTEVLAAGRNPRVTALDIIGRVDRATGRRSGGIVGLSAAQERYVAGARTELLSGDPDMLRNYLSRVRRDARFDATIARAIAEERPLDRATVDRIVGRYADRLLDLRGETIARTETLTALNASQREAFEQAIEAGGIARQTVRKVWRSAGDGRTRDTHASLSGDTAGMDEPFRSPSGALMMHPGDTSLGAGPSEIANCRCIATYRIDYLSNLR